VFGRLRSFSSCYPLGDGISVRLDGGFVEEHDRYVILDWVDTFARGTFQARVVVHEHDRCLALRAGKDFKQGGVEAHA